MNDLSRPPIRCPEEVPAGADLVILAKSVNAPPDRARQNRAELFSRQRLAASILGRERVGKCLWSIADNESSVRILRRNSRARFAGLQTCGSVWMCPVCSARISEVRRVELNSALAQARVLGIGVWLITLTARHSASDPLLELLSNIKRAKQHWHNSRTLKGYKSALHGTITATELTHGKNGWHPHFHLLMFIAPFGDPTELDRFKDDLQSQWITSLKACGLDGNGAAFDMQNAERAGQYVAKWGAAEELTLSVKKKGDSASTAGRHPFDFLRTAAHSAFDRALFYTYATTFKGRRQLQWTPGLRDLLSVPLKTDEEAAVIDPTEEDEWLMSINPDSWKIARRKGRARLLETCEDAGNLDALDVALECFEESPNQES